MRMLLQRLLCSHRDHNCGFENPGENGFLPCHRLYEPLPGCPIDEFPEQSGQIKRVLAGIGLLIDDRYVFCRTWTG